jgi:membrane fusion protein, multidrug efflux system
MTASKASTYFYGACALMVGCTAPETGRPTGPQAVRVADARRGSIVEGQSYLGEVISARQIKVVAQVPGQITVLPFDEGAAVHSGDEVARIAAPEISARLAKVRAERGRAERERDFLCKRVRADRALAAAGDLPADALDRAEQSCRAARLGVKAAQASEREAGVFNARSVERAPFDSVVLDRLVEVGQTVGPGVPLMVLGSSARELSVWVPQEDLVPAIEVGAAVRIGAHVGVIRRLGPRARGPGRTVELRVTPGEGVVLSAVGATHRVRLIVGAREDAPQVPLGAVGHGSEGAFVVAINGTGAVRIPVTLGPKDDGWIAIEPALPAGARVALGAVARVDVSAPVLPVLVQP